MSSSSLLAEPDILEGVYHRVERNHPSLQTSSHKAWELASLKSPIHRRNELGVGGAGLEALHMAATWRGCTGTCTCLSFPCVDLVLRLVTHSQLLIYWQCTVALSPVMNLCVKGLMTNNQTFKSVHPLCRGLWLILG